MTMTRRGGSGKKVTCPYQWSDADQRGLHPLYYFGNSVISTFTGLLLQLQLQFVHLLLSVTVCSHILTLEHRLRPNISTCSLPKQAHGQKWTHDNGRKNDGGTTTHTKHQRQLHNQTFMEKRHVHKLNLRILAVRLAIASQFPGNYARRILVGAKNKEYHHSDILTGHKR